MRSRFPKVRSSIQQAFVSWYIEHQDNFIRPLLWVLRTDAYLVLSLPRLNPAISITLNSSEFGVYTQLQGKYWDLLMAYDSYPELTENGYFDKMTLPDYRVLYDSRAALWQAEMFEPLMDWINNKLLTSKWLGLYQRCDLDGRLEATWSELLTEPDLKAFVLLPVWLDSDKEQQSKKYLISQKPTHH